MAWGTQGAWWMGWPTGMGAKALSLLPLRLAKDRQIYLFSGMGMGGIGDMRPKQQNAASDLRAGVRTAQADKLAPPIALQKLRPKIRRAIGLLPA